MDPLTPHVVRRFLAGAEPEKAVMNVGEKHPMAGQTVEVVRRDPFKRFVVVRVLKTVNRDYKKGDELRFKPEELK